MSIMWISRDIEPLVAQEAQLWPCLVVTGCRQAGKTSLLRHVLGTRQYAALDLPGDAEQAEEDADAFLRRFPPPATFDEVQYAPRLLRHIKAWIDGHPNDMGLFAIAGSQRFGLMAGVGESLAGRAAVIDCHSLSAQEVERFWRQPLEGDALLKAIHMGGYPRLHAQGLDTERFFASYVATYLERDVRQALQVRSLRDFDRFFRMLALRTGQLVSSQAIAAEVGVASGTIRAWLSVLEASNIIAMIPPYSRNVGKRLVKTAKMYFMDTGLACWLAGLASAQDLRRSALLGPMFETYVAGQLIRHDANLGRRRRLCFYRDAYGTEVDFLVEVGEKIHLMECKWNASASLQVPGFVALQKLVGDSCVLSRTVITSKKGYTLTRCGVARGDSVSFPFLA